MSFCKVPFSVMGTATITVWSLVNSILLCKGTVTTVWLLMLTFYTLAMCLLLTNTTVPCLGYLALHAVFSYRLL